MPKYDVCVPEAISTAVEPIAYDLIRSGILDEFGHFETETSKVSEMNLGLRMNGTIGDYTVLASLAFAIPEDTTPDQDGNVEITRMDSDTEFRGDLIGGSALKIFRDLGGWSVRAVCLRFSDVLINYRTTEENGIVPMFIPIEDTHRLFVPYFALKNMQRMD